MDIRKCVSIVIYCVIIIKDSSAKTFSLNEAIAAESQQKRLVDTTSTPKLQESTAEKFSLNKALTPNSLLTKKIKETENFFLRSKKLSPLKYRRAFQIKTPLKPRKLKRSPGQKHKGKTQSIKREINGSEKFNQKYIPLLKSIGMLFDNLLDTDASNSYEVTSHKRRRHRHKSISSEDDSRMVCKCAIQSDNGTSKSESTEKATAIPNFRTTASISTEDITTIGITAASTDYPPVSDISSVRQHKNIPILLPGDPVSSRRNDYGISERSSAAYHRSAERYLTRDYGNSKHNTRYGEYEPNTPYYEEITYSHSRDSTSSDGTHGGELGNGNNTSRTVVTSTSKETVDYSEDEDAPEDYKLADKFKREDNLETRRNETKSTKLLSKPVRRLRGHLSEKKIDYNTESQSKEIYAKSILNDTNNNTSHKRIINRSSSTTTENQETRSGNEAIMSNDNILSSNIKNMGSVSKAPLVMIIDGYSVTRNKHGENKMTKKSIHFHP